MTTYLVTKLGFERVVVLVEDLRSILKAMVLFINRRTRGVAPQLGEPHDRTLLEKFTIQVQSWIVTYFHNRIVGKYCTLPGLLTFGTMRNVPGILLPAN